MNYIVALILVFNFFVCNGAAADAASKKQEATGEKVTFSEAQIVRGKKVITVSVQNLDIWEPLSFENMPLFYKFLKNNRFLVASENEIKICLSGKPNKSCKLDHYIRDVIELSSGKLAVMCDKCVIIVDSSLNVIKEIGYDGQGWISFVYELCDGRFLVINELGNNKFQICIESLKGKAFDIFYNFTQQVKAFDIDELTIKITPENGSSYNIDIPEEESLEDLLNKLSGKK